MTVVEPEFWSDPKPDLDACVCGCGVVARPRVKAWQDGLGPHNRGCPCRRCVGGRQSSRARRREHRVAKAAGGAREPFSGALSGVDGRAGLTVWEDTANVALTRGFRRWIESKGTTSKMSRLMARTGVRRAYVLAWDSKPRWVVMPFTDWADLVVSEESDADGRS